MPEDRVKSKRGTYLRPGRIINGFKICPQCKERKLIKEFYKDKTQKSGVTSVCKKCNNIRCQKWRRGKGKKKFFSICRKSSWKKKGIIFTQEEYNNKFNQQSGCCAICERHQSEFQRRLAVDHNHLTGEIRGLLCGRCNYIVGAVESNGKIIPLAKKYLKIWRVV